MTARYLLNKLRSIENKDAIVCIGLINNIFTFEMVLQIQLLIGGIIATICEGITGLILIAIYGENTVWNYSDLYGTFFWGQCNIFFCLIWIILSFVAILIADIVDYYLFDGERPYYKINKSKIWFMLPKK